MEVVRALKKNAIFHLLYLASFFISFHLFLLTYINSSFLTTFVDKTYVGIIYVVGALLAIGALFFIVNVLRTIGNYKTLLALTLIEMGLVLSLAIFTKAFIIIPIFILYLTIYPLILFGLDIFLESFSKTESTTGNVRGIFLTMQSIALVLSPLVIGLIVGNDNFWKVYVLSAAFIIPFIYVIIRRFRNFADPAYNSFHIRKTLSEVFHNRNLYGIFMSQFIMRLFFAWMVIYTPIYLHEQIGFEWSAIGIIFTIMLLPYLLVEWPAGKIADSRFGEKEMLTLGFIIAAFATVFISIVTEANLILWAIILLFTRLGTSLIEIMTESYFFKHVDGNDADIISLFRMIRPLGYVIGPILATLLLLVIDLRFIFVVLSVILLYGIRYSLSIKDTR